MHPNTQINPQITLLTTNLVTADKKTHALLTNLYLLGATETKRCYVTSKHLNLNFPQQRNLKKYIVDGYEYSYH